MTENSLVVKQRFGVESQYQAPIQDFLSKGKQKRSNGEDDVLLRLKSGVGLG